MAGITIKDGPCRRCGENKQLRRHVPSREDGYIVYILLCNACIKEQLYGQGVQIDRRLGHG